MKQHLRRLFLASLGMALAAQGALAQKALTWQEVRNRFQAANPSLQAGQIGIDESKASETTAYLRPNPTLALLADQIDPFPGGPAHGPFAFVLPSATSPICMSASTSENCAWIAQKEQPESPFRIKPT